MWPNHDLLTLNVRIIEQMDLEPDLNPGIIKEANLCFGNEANQSNIQQTCQPRRLEMWKQERFENKWQDEFTAAKKGRNDVAISVTCCKRAGYLIETTRD